MWTAGEAPPAGGAPDCSEAPAEPMLEASVEDDRADRDQLVAAVDRKVDLGALGISGRRLVGGLVRTVVMTHTHEA